MGSKSKIANKICGIFPNAENFYDLFGGGFSITHCMLKNRFRDFKNFHFNEIRPGICELIQSAIKGDYSYDKFKPEFIDRETFDKKKDSDPYIKMIWSFANNGSNYLFGKDIESYKRSMHNAVVFGQFDDLARQTLGVSRFEDDFDIPKRRFFLRNRIEYFRKSGIPDFLKEYLNKDQLERIQQLEQLQRLQQLEQLQRLERLEQLQQLQQLGRLEQLQFYNLDYRSVEIKESSVVYCDPPYIGTADYGSNFNHQDFYDWAANQGNPVFISEYELKDSRFKCVFKTDKRSLLSSNKKMNTKQEKVFVNNAAFKALLRARAKKVVNVLNKSS